MPEGQSTSLDDDFWSGCLVVRKPWVTDRVFGGLEVIGSVLQELDFVLCMYFYVALFILYVNVPAIGTSTLIAKFNLLGYIL